jgi:hypothetical protein
MVLDINIFRCIAPEFSEVSNTKLNEITAFVQYQINEDCWSNRAPHGLALLVAHTLTLGERGGTSGSITSEKVGDLARSYSGPTGDDELDTTSYGKEFKRLRKMLVISPYFVC